MDQASQKIFLKTGLTILGGLCFAAMLLFGCNSSKTEENNPKGRPSAENTSVKAISGSSELPQEVIEGEKRFNQLCAPCHGPAGTGTNMGPPLVHKIYEPSHHGDMAFIRAATQGVRAHHWDFGNMPKVEGATVDDVKEIIKYIRYLQRKEGIY